MCTFEELCALDDAQRAVQAPARGRELLPERAFSVTVRSASLVVVSQGRGRTTSLRGQQAADAIAALNDGHRPKAPGRSRNSCALIWKDRGLRA
jgi:hypothetical protein